MKKIQTAQELIDSVPTFLTEEEKKAVINKTDAIVNKEIERETKEIVRKLKEKEENNGKQRK